MMKSYLTIGIFVIATIGVLIVIGCVKPTEPAVDSSFDGTLSKLRFESPIEEKRMKQLDQCIEDLSDSSWHSIGYETVGNFYEKRWCKGSGAPNDCQIASGTALRKDQYILKLNTLFYPQTPEVFGLGFQVHKNPESAGWGIDFSLDEDGKTVVGEQFSIIFAYFDSSSEKPLKTISLANYFDYPVYEKRVFFGSNTSLRDDLAEYLSSAERMRDHGLEQLDALEKKVYDYLNSGEAVRCEYGPYKGGGIPPECTERPLTEEERKESLDKAGVYFSEERRILTQDYQNMYGELMKVFPFQSCWE